MLHPFKLKVLNCPCALPEEINGQPSPTSMSSGDDLKSSAQVWGGNNQSESLAIDDSPPAYSGATEESNEPPNLPVRPRKKPVPRETYSPIHAISKWIKIPWNRYVLPDATVSADRTVVSTTSSAYLSNPQALAKLLADQADLPPMPTLRIVGNHSTNTASRVLDFDILVNLSTLLDLSRQPRWHVKPAQVVPLPSPDGRNRASSSFSGNSPALLEVLARQFLKDKSDRKSFVLNRIVENLPKDVIEGLVRNLVASVHYRGRLTIEFPVHCGQLIVQKKPAGAGTAVGGWFMNVLGLSPDVKYEPLERVWEIGSSSLPSVASTSGQVEDDNGDQGDQSEANVLVREWWNAWAPAIRDAVLVKRKGKVGIEDWIEAQMGWRPTAPTHDWGVDYV